MRAPGIIMPIPGMPATPAIPGVTVEPPGGRKLPRVLAAVGTRTPLPAVTFCGTHR